MVSLFQNEKERILLATIASIATFTPKKLAYILEYYDTLDEAVNDVFKRINAVGQKWLEKLIKTDITSESHALQQKLDKYAIDFFTCFDECYPAQLRNLEDYPLVLFYQGNLAALDHQSYVTVVGSRGLNQYGKSIMRTILPVVCNHGVGVVSGLAMGVDGMSHTLALEANELTIGVIGSSVDDESFYPQSNLGLKKEIIAKGGLVLSEYAPQTQATVYSFPHRNRILAALTNVTWVVQASKKSGTLITASIARDLGRIVATTPAHITEQSFSGNIDLIKNGAQIVTDPEDLLQLLGINYSTQNIQATVIIADPDQKKVYDILVSEPTNVDHIMLKTGFTSDVLVGILTMLELQGHTESVGGNNWIKKR